jgi:hypothetical protein
MPYASSARTPPGKALDHRLAALFRRLQAEPLPPVLLSLVDELEDAWRGATIQAEPRSIG